MIEYNAFNVTKSILISNQFKKKHSTLDILGWKPNIHNASNSWLDSTIEPAAGCDMYCHNYDNLRILRANYNCNQPAIHLGFYDRDCYYEDVIWEKF